MHHPPSLHSDGDKGSLLHAHPVPSRLQEVVLVFRISTEQWTRDRVWEQGEHSACASHPILSQTAQRRDGGWCRQ